MILLTILPNGDLKIAIDPEYDGAREEIEALIDKPLDYAFADMLDSARYLGNDWHIVPPESIGALTDSPIIGRGAMYDPGNDQGLPDTYCNLWWYPNYQISDPVEVLLRDGEVIFSKCEREVAEKKAKILTWSDFDQFSPCYSPTERYGDWSGTMLQLLEREDIPDEDRLWAFCTGIAWEQPERDKFLRLFACKCVRETPIGDGRVVWDLLSDERSKNAVIVAERYAEGLATKEELAAAWDAAWDAARAAWDAAGAAGAAARDAAWDAVRDAAREAAWAAALDAALAAARDAAWDAARDAAREAQIQIAKTFLI